MGVQDLIFATLACEYDKFYFYRRVGWVGGSDAHLPFSSLDQLIHVHVVII